MTMENFDESVMSQIGSGLRSIESMEGQLHVTQELCAAGTVRPSVLMFQADMVVGVPLEVAYPEWTYTTDFSIRMAGTPVPPGTMVEARGRPLRLGSKLLVHEVDYRIETGEQVARVEITFIRQPLRDGEGKEQISHILERLVASRPTTLATPLAEAVGIRVVDPTEGHVELNVGDHIRRSGGFVQGAMMSLLGEVSAQALGEAHLGCPAIVTDLDIRYLIGGRTGPLVAEAAWIGEPGQSAISVKIVDRGHDDVVTTTFLARVMGAG